MRASLVLIQPHPTAHRIEAVREAAEGLHQIVAMSANDGKHHGTEIPVADPETVRELRTRLNQHLYKTEGTHV